MCNRVVIYRSSPKLDFWMRLLALGRTFSQLISLCCLFPFFVVASLPQKVGNGRKVWERTSWPKDEISS